MKRTLRLILVFLLAAILLACPSCAEENGSKREGLTVSFLSVGQGDAILITLPEGNLLIDGGGDASFAASFAEELERAGVDALDCLIITHPERDHVAYLPALLEEIPVRRAFLPYIEEDFSHCSTRRRGLRGKRAARLNIPNCTIRLQSAARGLSRSLPRR